MCCGPFISNRHPASKKIKRRSGEGPDKPRQALAKIFNFLNSVYLCFAVAPRVERDGALSSLLESRLHRHFDVQSEVAHVANREEAAGVRVNDTPIYVCSTCSVRCMFFVIRTAWVSALHGWAAPLPLGEGGDPWPWSSLASGC